MKSTHLIPLATLGAICGLSFLGIAPKVLANPVDVELAFLLDASGSSFESDILFENIRDAHSALFQSNSFFSTYVDPLPLKKIAVSFWIYADGVANPVNWALIDSPIAAFNFGTAIGTVTKTLPLNRINLGQAIENATVSVNTNAFDGDYRILNLMSNGEEARTIGTPSALDAAIAALSPQGGQISAINSISTEQVPTSVLPSIIGLPTNNDNPINQPGFSLTDLSFDPDPMNPSAPSSYALALSQKVYRETVGTRAVATPEPSAIFALLGLSLIPLAQRLKKSLT